VPPYDNAGWTLSYQMGVAAIPVDQAVTAPLTRVTAFPRIPAVAPPPGRYGYALDPRENNTVTAVQRLERKGIPVFRATGALTAGDTILPPGAFVLPRGRAADSLVKGFAAELGLAVHPLDTRPSPLVPLAPRRIGVYRSWATEWVDDWVAGEGWTRWMFDQYEIPFQSLANADVRGGNLRQRFDVIVVPDQALDDILHGYHAGRRQFELPHQTLPPPLYQGGIEDAGVAALKTFVEQGGTLILVDRACDLGTETLGLPVKNVVAGLKSTAFFVPGSIVRATVDSTSPLGYGLPGEVDVFFRKSRVLATADPSARVMARYAATDVLRSGWMVGEAHLAGQAAVVEASLGKGRIVLLGFSPYFRGQPHGTFKIFFNALY